MDELFVIDFWYNYKNMNLALIGLGPHAKRIYLRFLLKHNIEPALIVDLVSQ